jgi:hypothetical protein
LEILPGLYRLNTHNCTTKRMSKYTCKYTAINISISDSA